ncbi:MAG: triple tyrosine motif-containing protein, partial [Bacteroidota bacterium]
LFIYHTAEKKIKSSFNDRFLNIYKIDGRILVNTEEETLELLNGQLQAVTPTTDSLRIAKAVPVKGKNQTLILDYEGQVYIYENQQYQPLVINDQITELDLGIIDIQHVNDSLIAGSTLDKGCVFLNIKSNRIELLDHSKGLADNELFAIHTDREGGLWISHEHGLSRILPSFPARSYSHLPGISGNLLSVRRTVERLWLTSSAGIFYFDRDTSFTNKVYYEVRDVNQPAKKTSSKRRTTSSRKRVRKSEARAKSSEEASASSATSTKKKKKGVFNRLFKKKKQKLDEQGATEDQQKPKSDPATKEQKRSFLKKIISKVDNLISSDAKTTDKVSGKLRKDKVYIRRTRKVPTGITYRYTKVHGSEGKTTELIVFNDKLLGVSTSGLFEISKDSAHLVIDEPIEAAIKLKDSNSILVLTYDQRIKLYELESEIWIEKIVFDPSDIIKDIYQDEKGNIWLAGSSEVFLVTIEGEDFVLQDEFKIENYRFDNILMTSIRDTTFFINTQGYYYLDKSINQLKSYDKWKQKMGQPLDYFKDSHNFVWIYNGKTWFEISEFGSIEVHRYFGLFPGLRKITYDQVLDQYWLITGKNQLLAFDHTAEGQDSTLHPLFLKKIKAINGVLKGGKNLMINHDNTYLSFEMSKPDYLGLLNTEYQYKLEGMNNNWSEWSSNSKIDFSFLQPGRYTLQVQSRDSFGNIEKADPISFTVRTPYWQTPWFYALQILVFGSLVFLSSKLSETNTRNRILKSALTILTLVLIIEFLQSALAAYLNIKSTPVGDFLIDVGTALVVFPVERFLRNVMLGKITFNPRKLFGGQSANEEDAIEAS